MTTINIIDHRPVYRDGDLVSGQFELSNGFKGGYLTAKDGEVSLHLERPAGGFVSEAQGFYRTSDPIEAIKLVIGVMGWAFGSDLTETGALIRYAQRYVDVIGEDGTGYRTAEAMAQTDERSVFVGTTLDSDADWEVCVDHENCAVSVIVRHYRDGKIRTTFATSFAGRISRVEAEAEIRHQLAKKAAKARQVEADEQLEKTGVVNLNQLVRNGLPTSSCTTYDEWDLIRRELFKAHDGDAAIEGVEVEHYEHETVVYLVQPELGGQVVASWCCATGTCRIKAPRQAAQDIAESIGNLISNSLQYGWGEVQ